MVFLFQQETVSFASPLSWTKVPHLPAAMSLHLSNHLLGGRPGSWPARRVALWHLLLMASRAGCHCPTRLRREQRFREGEQLSQGPPVHDLQTEPWDPGPSRLGPKAMLSAVYSVGVHIRALKTQWPQALLQDTGAHCIGQASSSAHQHWVGSSICLLQSRASNSDVQGPAGNEPSGPSQGP